jgi:hypothetical protein
LYKLSIFKFQTTEKPELFQKSSQKTKIFKTSRKNPPRKKNYKIPDLFFPNKIVLPNEFPDKNNEHKKHKNKNGEFIDLHFPKIYASILLFHKSGRNEMATNF